MFAVFKISGKTPFIIDKLNIYGNGAEITEFTACNGLILTSSYPGAESLGVRTNFVTSSHVTGANIIVLIRLALR